MSLKARLRGYRQPAARLPGDRCQSVRAKSGLSETISGQAASRDVVPASSASGFQARRLAVQAERARLQLPERGRNLGRAGPGRRGAQLDFAKRNRSKKVGSDRAWTGAAPIRGRFWLALHSHIRSIGCRRPFGRLNFLPLSRLIGVRRSRPCGHRLDSQSGPTQGKPSVGRVAGTSIARPRRC